MSLHFVYKLRRGLAALAFAVPLLYIVFASVVVVVDYRSTIAQAQSDMRNIAATLSEHAMRTFGEADTRLRTVIADIERRRLTLSPANERDIHDILVAALEGLPQAASLNVVGADGVMRASASVYPLRPIDSRDREYWTYLSVQSGQGMHVSRPIQSRTGAKWTIPLARRVDNPDGSLKMIVNFGVDMAYFDRLYRSLQLGDSSRLLLLRRDGWVIMETPLTSRVMGLNLSGTRVFQLIDRAPTGVYATSRSAVDDDARVVGYASMAQAPLFAVASIGRDEVLKPWRTRCWEIAGIGLVSTLLLLGLLRFLWLRLADLEIVQAGLARRNEELDAARKRFQELVDGIDGVVWEAELPNFRFTYVSGNAEAISGYSACQWVEEAHFWRDRLCAGLDGKQVEPVLAVDGPGLLKPIEHHIMTPDRREIWLRSNVMLAGSISGRLQIRGITMDITHQKQSDLELFQAVHVDPLTKLPNRRALVERARHALAIAQKNQSVVAIVLVDVDKFNTLNDSLGHDVGDEILVQIGARLKDCAGPTDMLARMGGDEFAVVMEDVDRCAIVAEQLAERISEALARTIPVGARELYLTVSMGIALFPQDGLDYHALLRNADTALYRAKAAGRNGWQFFDSSMARVVEHRLDMETALRHAIEHNEFSLHYQPQGSLKNGNIIGVEALVRWNRPGVGMVPPQEFIAMAEEGGFIVALGIWVLRTACIQAAAWHQIGMQLRIAVNVSVIQLRQPDFVAQVRHALAASKLPAHCLELEITEGTFVADVHDAFEKLHEVKALGVELAVDDFGTGYSSLSYLKQMPFDRLKVDQSFVRDIPESADDCAIVRAILSMARNLNLGVIAEGVESQAQQDFLRAEGCDEMQGFFLSPALPAEAFSVRFPLAGHALERRAGGVLTSADRG